MKNSFSTRTELARRTFEIAYAFFRIAGVANSRAYADSLEILGVSFIQGGSRKNWRKILDACVEGEQLLNLGLGCDLVGVQNGTTVLSLIREIKKLSINFSGLAEEADILISGNFKNEGDRPISDLESEDDSAREGTNDVANEAREEISVIVPDGNISEVFSAETRDSVSRESETVFQGVSGEAKQLAVLNYIRKSGETKMRDLQNLFPDVNERLLRYHLQKLGQKGLIQQFGSAAATHYKAVYPDTFSGYRLPDNQLKSS